MYSIAEQIKTNGTVRNSDCNRFGYLTDKHNKLIKRNQVTVECRIAEIIAKQGAFTTRIFYIYKRLTKVYYEANNKNLILKIASGGSFIGLASLPQCLNVFQSTASAYVDTTVNLIDTNVIRQIIIENSKFANWYFCIN